MRWHTAQFGSSQEIKEQARVSEQIERFWKQFVADSETLRNNFFEDKTEETVAWCEAYLKPIHEDLMWEVSRDILEVGDKRLVFTVTPESEYGLRPLTKSVIERAPEIAKWRFTQFKEPLIGDFNDFEHSMLKHSWAEVQGQINESPLKCFDITLRDKQFKKENKDADIADALTVLTTVLGEEPVDVWINFVMTQPLTVKKTKAKSKAASVELSKVDTETAADLDESEYLAEEKLEPQPFYPLNSLRNILASRVVELVDELPIERCWERELDGFYSLKGSSWEEGLRPVITTPYPATIFAKERRMLFHSSAFTRHDEVFAYLKMTQEQELAHDVEARFELEDKLDRELRKAKAGCVLGGGVGSEAAYIDLIISDLTEAANILREQAKKAEMPETSWLLFYDTYWVDEWIGMFKRTPPPGPHEGPMW
ncbi:MAG: hypothetical protein Q8T09_16265 [Candidatus Melainabacteria bacterium]|nr:hypothetical protein [Candidatus Melainabacteria bacterium]